ncbi:unnamed protein product [Boreogadus saida]
MRTHTQTRTRQIPKHTPKHMQHMQHTHTHTHTHTRTMQTQTHTLPHTLKHTDTRAQRPPPPHLDISLRLDNAIILLDFGTFCVFLTMSAEQRREQKHRRGEQHPAVFLTHIIKTFFAHFDIRLKVCC